MAFSDIDLAAYFDRIGYGGPAEPTLAALREVHRLHVAAIPFENLSPLIGDEVPLDLEALQAKLVRGGRGGYCFEHNTLLWAALQAMGFEIQGLAARVLWGAPPDAPLRHRSHMALLVSLPEGKFVADVGFGGITMSAPLALQAGAIQQTPHEPFRLAAASDDAYDRGGGGRRALAHPLSLRSRPPTAGRLRAAELVRRHPPRLALPVPPDGGAG